MEYTGTIFYLGFLLMTFKNLNFPYSEAGVTIQSRQAFGEVTEPSTTSLSTEVSLSSTSTVANLHQGPIGSETSESTTTDLIPESTSDKVDLDSILSDGSTVATVQSSSVPPLTPSVPSQDKDVIVQQENSSSESDSEDSSSSEEIVSGGCGQFVDHSSESEENMASSSESSSSSSSESYEWEFHFPRAYFTS